MTVAYWSHTGDIIMARLLSEAFVTKRYIKKHTEVRVRVFLATRALFLLDGEKWRVVGMRRE